MSRPLCIAIALVLWWGAAAQAQTLRQLHSFDAPVEGSSTVAPLIHARDGFLYGVNRFDGPHSRGTLFRMTTGGTLTVLHAFTGGADGARPSSQLLEGIDDFLYGVTIEGGLHNRGVAFRISRDGTLTVLHAFGGASGASAVPMTLIHSGLGDLYGTSCSGGTHDAGTVFRMSLAGGITPMYSFTNGDDGLCPASLLLGRDGMLYGTASGGTLGDGVAFRMTRDGGFTRIHDYRRNVEGGAPGPLLQSRIDGQLYGVTRSTRGFLDFTYGSVYRMSTSGDVQVLHTFGSGQYQGIYPVGALVEGGDGNFYGMTEHGGLPYSYYTTMGTIFRVTRTGAHTVLRLFRGAPEGMHPQTGLTLGRDGHLYGSATGGWNGAGVLFRLETYLCTASLDASYHPATEFLQLFYGLQSAGPGTWSLWAITPFGAGELWSLPIGAVPEPWTASIGHVLPHSGPILFVSTLTVPGFGSCFGVAFVDSSP